MQQKNDVKNLEGLEMEIVMLNGKIKLEKLGNTLDEFEMNELEAKLNTKIEVLEEKKKKQKKI